MKDEKAKTIDQLIDRLSVIVEKLTALAKEREADTDIPTQKHAYDSGATVRARGRSAVDIDPQEFAGMTAEEAQTALARRFEEIIRQRRLEALGRR